MPQDLQELTSQYYNRRYMRQSSKGTRLSLAAVTVTLNSSELRKIGVSAEYALQAIAVECAEEAKANVIQNIRKTWPNMLNRPYSDGDIVDTGAGLESVHVIYPASQRVQTRYRRSSPDVQAKNTISPKTTKDYLRSVKAIQKLKPHTSKISKDFDSVTRRLLDKRRKDYEPADELSLSLGDEPINPLMNLNRSNLYVGLAVSAPHMLFQEEGFHARGTYVPPRAFFSEEVLEMQRRFANKTGNLERYMTKK